MGSNPSEDQVMETLHESINSQMRTLHEDQMVSVIHVLISPSVFSDWIIKGLTRHGFLIRPIMSDMHGGWDGPVLARNLIIAERKVSAHYLTNEGDGWWFRSQVPVIYIVEEGIDCQWLSPAEAGAVDYIFKPFPLNELVFRINLALGRLQLTHEVSAKDIQLDLISRRAIKGGRDLNLSPREFELLATLISNQGRV